MALCVKMLHILGGKEPRALVTFRMKPPPLSEVQVGEAASISLSAKSEEEEVRRDSEFFLGLQKAMEEEDPDFFRRENDLYNAYDNDSGVTKMKLFHFPKNGV